MNNELFKDYYNKKENYNLNVKKIKSELDNNIINDGNYKENINKLKNEYKIYLSNLYSKIKLYMKESFNFDLDIYVKVKDYNSKMEIIHNYVIMNDLEFNNELHKIIYTLKNNNIDKILSNNIIDLITEYHMLILEDAPKRNNIPENNENRKTITEDKIINENVKKEKRSFFIKFLPTIIAVLGLLVAYIIYNAAF